MVKRVLFLSAAALLLLSCQKMENASRSGGRITMTVSLDREEPVREDGTRVTLTDDSTLVWEGNESVGVIFSKKAGSTTPYKYTQELKTVPGSPGVFSGTIELGEFTASDIVGIVYPYNGHCWGKYHTTSKQRIVMEVGTVDQIQPGSGKLSGDYLALFAPVTFSDFTVKGSNYTLAGRKLQWGCSLLEFNVYGRNRKALAGEKIEAVEAYATTTICQAGTAEWSIGNRTFAFVGETKHPHVFTALAKPCTFGETRSGAVSLFASVLPRGEVNGTTVEYTDIFVFTDKAVYKKTFSKKVLLMQGKVLPINLDLSTFERTSRTVASGYDSVMFFGYKPLSHKPVKLYYNIPGGFSKTTMPVLFVMHGNGRTANSYLNSFKTASGSKGFIAVAPEFTKTLFSSKQYHLGWVSNSTTAFEPMDKELWTYNIIESLFDFVKEQTGNTSAKYDIWGHSAGGQFVHRFLLNMPEARVNRAIESNAGYYTVPDPKGISDGKTRYGFPYSIYDMSIPNSQLKKYFSLNMTVHLGTADTATTQAEDPDLPVSDGAEAQGTCRFERGQFFYNRAKRVADSLGYPFNWKLEKVKGVAHSGSKMAQNSTNGAIVLLYGK